ncbi:pleckstrin homology domain-containing family G member 7-like isoform X3 [Rhopilema esculentum]|uniref:pleckstrin homology domain-containing family G member 7-like isoform X3 n=1 Tax=Rhopilema esculentum TaxID=499914 RepID=UPI0031D98FF8
MGTNFAEGRFFILAGHPISAGSSIRRSNSRKEKVRKSDKIDAKLQKAASLDKPFVDNNVGLEKKDSIGQTNGILPEVPVITVENEDSESWGSGEDMSDDKFVGESEEDAAMRRAALQCTRSSRRRLPNATEVEPDSNLRMDLHTLYLEATGHKVNDSRNLEGKTPWAMLKNKLGGKKANLESLRVLLEEMGECGKDLATHALVKYKHLHWTDLSGNILDEAAVNALPTKERKRFEAVWELFHAEVTYITDHLLVLKEVFHLPMAMAKKFGFLDRVNPDIVFSNIDSLIQASTSFAEKLLRMFEVETEAQFGNSKTIISAFREFNLSLHPEYHEYCVNYSKARGHLNSLSEDAEFKEFMKWSEADLRCNRLRLNDLLVAPVQHLTKYPLLLKAIKTNTTKSSGEYDPLMAVINSVQKSIREIEGELHVLSNLEKIKEISENLVWPTLIENDPKTFIPEFMKAEISNRNCSSIFANPWRVLLLDGYLTLIDGSKSELFVLLFDDMILLTKYRRAFHGKLLKRRNTSHHLLESSSIPEEKTSPSVKRSGSTGSDLQSPSYLVFRQPISLDRMRIYDCEEYVNSGSAYKHSFVLESHNRFCQTLAVCTLQASGSKEKDNWVKQIRTAQKNFTDQRSLNEWHKDSMFVECNNNESRRNHSDTFSEGIDSVDCGFKGKRVLSSPSLTSTVDRFRQGRLRLFSIPH